MTDRLHEDIGEVLVGGGETGALMRSIDWSQTPLGPVHAWPQSLRTALSISMSSRFPITLYWGGEFLMLYNDDLLPMVGANKHPWALGRPAFEVLPEIRSIIEPLLRRVVDTGEAIWSEDLMLPMQRGDAPEEGYFTFTYSPVRDESGGVGGVFCAVLETTDRIIEGRRLRLLNALTDATRAKTPVEACAFAAAKIAEATNDVPFALLYLADEPAGLVRLAGIANIDPDDALAPATIALGDHSVWPFDLNDAENEERIVPLENAPGGARGAVILPIERAGGGRALGFIVAGLSSLLRSSESYGRFHHLLAASVAQIVSNAAAHEAERKRAEALAEIDHAKTAFFSNVSHEFRTPLTLLLGPAEDALRDPETSAANRERIEIIHRNALRLQKLVTALLDFSRIEAGRMQATYAPTDVASLTADVASAFRSAIENAGLRFNVDTPPIGLPIYLDRGMWETILLNLLSNAFKFTLRGEIGVRLRPTGKAVELIVSDTGSGIPEHELPHLFQRFHRVKGTEGRTHEGTGIGLALIQELVKLHGGTISVSSREGAGTTFTVAIPSGSAHLPAERIGTSATTVSGAALADVYVDETVHWLRKEPTPETPRGAVDDGQPRPRIVLADDNADMRDYVRGLLASRYDVVACPDGRAALEEIRRKPPDLVLSDVMMPELDGFGLLAALRADTVLCTLPVILLSARAGEESKIEGMEAGADDYLIKPFSARELMARVGAQIAISTMRREAQRAEIHALQEAEQALRDADRMKDEFLATLSHELRTPLTSILGWAHMLLSANLPKAERILGLESIRNSAKTQSQLIEDVLDISRIVTGKMRLEREPADLAAIIDEAVSTVRPAAEAKQMPLTVTLDRALGRHFLDPMRIQQIVWNLLTNAIKFSPQGAPIDVSLRGEGSSAVVVVSDQGPGIAPDFLPVIFERFRQADGSARRGHTGLGLGLALVKELTELHGGTIRVESDLGRGTRFTVSLPLPAVRQLDPGEKESTASKERPLTGIRVLYVDDVEDARLMVSTMLRSYGADVESASSATDALLALQRTRPHVVVTDIAMPDRDGFDLLHAVQSNATWSALPVIALTAQSGIDDERRAKAAGFRSYLRKPVDVDHFVSVLAHVVKEG